VWSSEGVGTEIRVTIDTELPEKGPDKDPDTPSPDPLTTELLSSARVALLGFEMEHKGQKLLQSVLSIYLTEWWHSRVTETEAGANILLINEDFSILNNLVWSQVVTRPVVLLLRRFRRLLPSCLQALQTVSNSCIHQGLLGGGGNPSFKTVIGVPSLIAFNYLTTIHVIRWRKDSPTTAPIRAAEALLPRTLTYLLRRVPATAKVFGLSLGFSETPGNDSQRDPNADESSQVVSFQLVPEPKSGSRGNPPLPDETSRQQTLLYSGCD